MTDTRYRRLAEITERAGLNPEMLAESIERLVDSGRLMAPAGALTAAEAEFLDAHSGTTADPEALFDAQVRTSIEATEQERDALSTTQVARMLGVSQSRVRQMVNEGRLYALPASKGRGTSLQFPDWQFNDGKALPHVGDIAAAFPELTHPLAVRAFFLNARVEVGEADESMIVAQWLRSGGSIQPVMELVLAESYGI